jgi:hypothetical protein
VLQQETKREREMKSMLGLKKKERKKLICIHVKKNMFIIIASEVIGFLLAML